MDQIDRRLARVIGDSAVGARLGVAPLPAPVPELPDDPDRHDTAPPTINPNPSELTFEELNRGEPGTLEVIQGLNSRLRNYALRAGGIDDPSVLELNLADAVRLAQSNGPDYRDAEEQYIFSAISLMIERHLWGPRFFDDVSAIVGGTGDEGTFDNALAVVNTLRATQRLPYGGEAEARWIWSATEQLRSSVSGQYEQASRLVFDANIPLLRGAGMVAREDLIQAERDLVYAAREFEAFRRSYYVEIAQDYFNLLQNVSELQNTLLNITSLQLYVRQREALYNAGRISDFEVNQARNELINGMSSLASSRERYTLALDRFKIRLGIPVERPVRIAGARITVSEPSTDVEAASATALEYRLDVQNRRDQLVDSRRSVDNARNNLLPDLDLNGGVTVPTNPSAREGGVVLDPDQTQWETGLLLSLPLDRRIERLQLRQAMIRYEQEQRSLNQFLDNTVLDARRTVREIDLARFRLELAEAQVEMNVRRQREQELKADEVDTRDRLDTENDLLDARNSRDQAVTDLRIAILEYLDTVGLLRIASDGGLERLPGMSVEIEFYPIDFNALFSDEPFDVGSAPGAPPAEAPGEPPAEAPGGPGDGGG